MAEINIRRKLAREAARLLFAREQGEIFQARREAQRRLAAHDLRAFELPTNDDIREEFVLLAEERAAAGESLATGPELILLLRLLRVLVAFQPRWTPNFTEPPAVARPWHLHVVADDPAAVAAALAADQLDPTIVADDALTVTRPLPLRLQLQSTPYENGWSVSDLERRLAEVMPELDIYSHVGIPLEKRDRFDVYRSLLAALETVEQNPQTHPEGDALYHSLQVFALAREQLPYDEEFLLAALLHDVGKGIDKQEHVAAALEALDGYVTERTAWLIEQHHVGRQILDGVIGARAHRRLQASEDYDELLLLVRCDRDGCVPGAQVDDLDDALTYLRDLSAENG